MSSPLATAGRARNVSRSARYVGEVGDTHQAARLVEADEVAYPGESGDIGDRVLLAGEPAQLPQLLVQHAQQTLRLRDVAVPRTLVLVVPAGELVEEPDLTEHRSDASHLEHEPLDHVVAGRRVVRQETSGLVREIDEDRAGLEQRQRLAAGAVGIDDRRDLVVGIQRKELGRYLILRVEAHPVRLVGQARLLQHDGDLHAVRGRQRVELQAVGELRRPLARDGER